MATVNLLNSGWSTSRETSTINITANSTSVHFNMGYKLTDEMANAKAYIAIDASKYKSVTLKYSSKSGEGISSLDFGIYDNTTAGNTSGKIGIASDAWNASGGSVTIDVSSLTGTKYVGFHFYGNTYTLNQYVGWSVQQKVTITSLTAVERGYTLTYNANGGSGEPSSVSNITSTTISSTIPTRTGYDFLGWSTSSSATSASYVSGNLISLSSNVTLYAVWKKKTYAVTYNANGGSGAPNSQTKTYGAALTLSTTKPTKASTSAGSYTVTLNVNGGTCSSESLSAARTTKYTFSKWNTNSSGTGTSYDSGASYTTNAALSLYAIYTSSTSTAAVTLPTPTRDGFKFMGWATSSTATSGTTGSYTPTGNVTLYAIWKSMGLVYIYDGAGGFNPYKVLIYDGSGWNQYIPYIYTEAGWEVYSG